MTVRSCIRAAALVLGVIAGRSAVAQGLRVNGEWRPFRGDDASFAVMFPMGGPAGHRTVPGSTTTQHVYFDHADGLDLQVVESAPSADVPGGVNPTLDDFCAKCLGDVVSDTTYLDGPLAGRWVYTVQTQPGSRMRLSSLSRIVVAHRRMYTIGVTSRSGAGFPPSAELYLESFALCESGSPCLPRVAQMKPAPGVQSSPFRNLPLIPEGGKDPFTTGKDGPVPKSKPSP